MAHRQVSIPINDSQGSRSGVEHILRLFSRRRRNTSEMHFGRPPPFNHNWDQEK